MADQTVVNGIGMERTPEEEREFQIREQVRIRMEAQLEAELQKIREKEDAERIKQEAENADKEKVRRRHGR